MATEGNAQAPAEVADDHASPKKRRKVNHGIALISLILLSFQHALTYSCSMSLLPTLGEPPP